MPSNSHTPAPEEARSATAPQLNDLYLVDPTRADVLHISREHFVIEYTDNQFFLVDRGSVCGTLVAGQQVAEVEQGDERSYGAAMKSSLGRTHRRMSSGSRFVPLDLKSSLKRARREMARS